MTVCVRLETTESGVVTGRNGEMPVATDVMSACDGSSAWAERGPTAVAKLAVLLHDGQQVIRGVSKVAWASLDGAGQV